MRAWPPLSRTVAAHLLLQEQFLSHALDLAALRAELPLQRYPGLCRGRRSGGRGAPRLCGVGLGATLCRARRLQVTGEVLHTPLQAASCNQGLCRRLGRPLLDPGDLPLQLHTCMAVSLPNQHACCLVCKAIWYLGSQTCLEWLPPS